MQKIRLKIFAVPWDAALQGMGTQAYQTLSGAGKISNIGDQDGELYRNPATHEAYFIADATAVAHARMNVFKGGRTVSEQIFTSRDDARAFLKTNGYLIPITKDYRLFSASTADFKNNATYLAQLDDDDRCRLAWVSPEPEKKHYFAASPEGMAEIDAAISRGLTLSIHKEDAPYLANLPSFNHAVETAEKTLSLPRFSLVSIPQMMYAPKKLPVLTLKQQQKVRPFDSTAFDCYFIADADGLVKLRELFGEDATVLMRLDKAKNIEEAADIAWERVKTGTLPSARNVRAFAAAAGAAGQNGPPRPSNGPPRHRRSAPRPKDLP